MGGASEHRRDLLGVPLTMFDGAHSDSGQRRTRTRADDRPNHCCDAADDISDSIRDGIPDAHEDIPEAPPVVNQEVDYELHGADDENGNVIPEELGSLFPGYKQGFLCAIPVLDDDEDKGATAALRFGARDPWSSGHAVSVQGSGRAHAFC